MPAKIYEELRRPNIIYEKIRTLTFEGCFWVKNGAGSIKKQGIWQVEKKFSSLRRRRARRSVHLKTAKSHV